MGRPAVAWAAEQALGTSGGGLGGGGEGGGGEGGGEGGGGEGGGLGVLQAAVHAA